MDKSITREQFFFYLKRVTKENQRITILYTKYLEFRLVKAKGRTAIGVPTPVTCLSAWHPRSLTHSSENNSGLAETWTSYLRPALRLLIATCMHISCDSIMKRQCCFMNAQNTTK